MKTGLMLCLNEAHQIHRSRIPIVLPDWCEKGTSPLKALCTVFFVFPLVLIAAQFFLEAAGLGELASIVTSKVWCTYREAPWRILS